MTDFNAQIEKAERDNNFWYVHRNKDGKLVGNTTRTATGLVDKKGAWKNSAEVMVPETRMIGTKADIKDYLMQKSGFNESQINQFLANAVTSSNYQSGETGDVFADMYAARKRYTEGRPKAARSETPDLMGLMSHIVEVKIVSSGEEGPAKRTGGSRSNSLMAALGRALDAGKDLNVTNAKFDSAGNYTGGASAKVRAVRPVSILGTPSVPEVVANKEAKDAYAKAMKVLAASTGSDVEKARFMAGAREFKAGNYAGAAPSGPVRVAERSSRAPTRARTTAARRSPSPVAARRSPSPVARRSPSPVRTSPATARRSPVRAGSPVGSPPARRTRRTRVTAAQ